MPHHQVGIRLSITWRSLPARRAGNIRIPPAPRLLTMSGSPAHRRCDGTGFRCHAYSLVTFGLLHSAAPARTGSASTPRRPRRRTPALLVVARPRTMTARIGPDPVAAPSAAGLAATTDRSRLRAQGAAFAPHPSTLPGSCPACGCSPSRAWRRENSRRSLGVRVRTSCFLAARSFRMGQHHENWCPRAAASA